MAASNSHWTIDRKIPIAVLVTIVAGFVTVIYQAAAQDTRLSYVERRAEKIEQMGVDIAILKSDQNAIKESAKRIEDKLDKVIP